MCTCTIRPTVCSCKLLVYCLTLCSERLLEYRLCVCVRSALWCADIGCSCIVHVYVYGQPYGVQPYVTRVLPHVVQPKVTRVSLICTCTVHPTVCSRSLLLYRSFFTCTVHPTVCNRALLLYRSCVRIWSVLRCIAVGCSCIAHVYVRSTLRCAAVGCA